MILAEMETVLPNFLVMKWQLIQLELTVTPQNLRVEQGTVQPDSGTSKKRNKFQKGRLNETYQPRSGGFLRNQL